MKKKQIKKKEPQVVEIHIYVHQNGNRGGGGTYTTPVYIERPPYGAGPAVTYTC